MERTHGALIVQPRRRTRCALRVSPSNQPIAIGGSGGRCSARHAAASGVWWLQEHTSCGAYTAIVCKRCITSGGSTERAACRASTAASNEARNLHHARHVRKLCLHVLRAFLEEICVRQIKRCVVAVRSGQLEEVTEGPQQHALFQRWSAHSAHGVHVQCFKDSTIANGHAVWDKVGHKHRCSSDKSTRADGHTLVHARISRDARGFAHLYMASECRIGCQYNTIANHAIMTNMNVRHKHTIVPDEGDPATRSSASTHMRMLKDTAAAAEREP
mmetsp:Transcript_15144/g.32930  ORF Transcript_15144/g.32930 Transcript_15144/m.32930 type:complete len:273 (-) Transcript_15144:655-1473(-)